ncbi:UDP-N-acetylmuramate dehydrogenase [Psychrobacter pygoscelis]|uniref:UDP-N-acetylmuramate dehydrogenase n=1 Tax=Psychrobacter pygoscelis TaxID=2488563 RepID=UPI00103F4203|nr:UDP-N-acetylmuramate dehydrogenase [Psychrobacter pygoscelis]
MIQSYEIQSPSDLSSLNTMALACRANTLITLTDEAQVVPVITDITQNQQPLFILSGGSNVLLPPVLSAFVIRPMIQGIHILHETDSDIHIEVMAGENWHELVLHTVNNGWFGLENLALIPGLTGAAPVQNIGAYGVQLDDCVTHVRAYHLPTLTWHNFEKSACQFGYRDSIFKQQAGEWLITRVGFSLHKDASRIHAGYGDVQDKALALAKDGGRQAATPVDVMKAIIAIRQSKLPDPAYLPNCGSFFKNPVITTEQFDILKARFANIVAYRVDDMHTKVAAGWLIDHAGLKGDGIAPIMSHTQQALVLTNHTPQSSEVKANQKDVATTQAFIQQKIFDKFGIMLEREPLWIESNGQVNLHNTTLDHSFVASP